MFSHKLVKNACKKLISVKDKSNVESAIKMTTTFPFQALPIDMQMEVYDKLMVSERFKVNCLLPKTEKIIKTLKTTSALDKRIALVKYWMKKTKKRLLGTKVYEYMIQNAHDPTIKSLLETVDLTPPKNTDNLDVRIEYLIFDIKQGNYQNKHVYPQVFQISSFARSMAIVNALYTLSLDALKQLIEEPSVYCIYLELALRRYDEYYMFMLLLTNRLDVIEFIMERSTHDIAFAHCARVYTSLEFVKKKVATLTLLRAYETTLGRGHVPYHYKQEMLDKALSHAEFDLAEYLIESGVRL